MKGPDPINKQKLKKLGYTSQLIILSVGKREIKPITKSKMFRRQSKNSNGTPSRPKIQDEQYLGEDTTEEEEGKRLEKSRELKDIILKEFPVRVQLFLGVFQICRRLQNCHAKIENVYARKISIQNISNHRGRSQVRKILNTLRKSVLCFSLCQKISERNIEINYLLVAVIDLPQNLWVSPIQTKYFQETANNIGRFFKKKKLQNYGPEKGRKQKFLWCFPEILSWKKKLSVHNWKWNQIRVCSKKQSVALKVYSFLPGTHLKLPLHQTQIVRWYNRNPHWTCKTFSPNRNIRQHIPRLPALAIEKYNNLLEEPVFNSATKCTSRNWTTIPERLPAKLS